MQVCVCWEGMEGLKLSVLGFESLPNSRWYCAAYSWPCPSSRLSFCTLFLAAPFLSFCLCFTVCFSPCSLLQGVWEKGVSCHRAKFWGFPPAHGHTQTHKYGHKDTSTQEGRRYRSMEADRKNRGQKRGEGCCLTHSFKLTLQV